MRPSSAPTKIQFTGCQLNPVILSTAVFVEKPLNLLILHISKCTIAISEPECLAYVALLPGLLWRRCERFPRSNALGFCSGTEMTETRINLLFHKELTVLMIKAGCSKSKIYGKCHTNSQCHTKSQCCFLVWLPGYYVVARVM